MSILHLPFNLNSSHNSFIKDDFLGSITLDLCKFPRGAKTAKQVVLYFVFCLCMQDYKSNSLALYFILCTCICFCIVFVLVCKFPPVAKIEKQVVFSS